MKLLAFVLIAILYVDAFAQSESTIEVIKFGTGTSFKFKGLAIDTKNSAAYLGSWDKKEIVVVLMASKKHEVLKTKYSGKLNGMDCYLKNGIVYAVMNDVDDDPQHQPISVLILFDAVTQKVIRAYEAKGVDGRNHFNHVVVDDAGVAYISNTLKSNIFFVNTKDPKDTLKEFIHHSDLSWVHGIDISPDGTKLFTTAYYGGIKFLDLRTKTFSAFRDVTTAGDDGLKYYEGFLYGVGNNSIKRYTLDETQNKVVKIDTLLSNHAYFNDPRCLHVENGFLYCLANIEFEPVTFTRQNKPFSGAKLRDTYLIKLKLEH
jgi:hypothetical protein